MGRREKKTKKFQRISYLSRYTRVGCCAYIVDSWVLIDVVQVTARVKLVFVSVEHKFFVFITISLSLFSASSGSTARMAIVINASQKRLECGEENQAEATNPRETVYVCCVKRVNKLRVFDVVQLAIGDNERVKSLSRVCVAPFGFNNRHQLSSIGERKKASKRLRHTPQMQFRLHIFYQLA